MNDTCSSNDGLPKIPTNVKNVSPKRENFKREIVTQQFKVQKDLNNNNEKNKQTKITEEINELKETFAREIKKTCSELKSSDDNNKNELMKQEIRNLDTHIEHLQNKIFS